MERYGMGYDASGASMPAQPAWSLTPGVPVFPFRAAGQQPAVVGGLASAAATSTALSEDLVQIKLATDRLAELHKVANKELRCIEKSLYFIEKRSTF